LNILPGELTPYVFGGYGLTWLSGAAASAFRTEDQHPALRRGPRGEHRRVQARGRFQYNYLFDSINTSSNGVSANKGGNSDFWSATVDLGASFH